jgi:hypothetical protein
LSADLKKSLFLLLTFESLEQAWHIVVDILGEVVGRQFGDAVVHAEGRQNVGFERVAEVVHHVANQRPHVEERVVFVGLRTRHLPLLSWLEWYLIVLRLLSHVKDRSLRLFFVFVSFL